jgi:AraC-like DNA-binding protein
METDDLTVARQVTSLFWPAHTSETVGPEDYAVVLNRAIVGQFAMTFVRCSGRIRATFLEPSVTACLIIPFAGAVEITAAAGTYRALPDQPLFQTAGWMRRFEADPCRCLLINIPLRAVEEAVTAAGQNVALAPRHTPLRGEVANLLKGKSLSLARAVNANRRVLALQHRSEPERLQLLTAGIRRRESELLEVLAAALATAHVPKRHVPGDDVESWLAQHAFSREPLAKLAREAGISLRSLQRAFAKLGFTPQAFLRKVRLERAREMLVSGDDSLAVSDVAEAVGYSHLGRFAGYYVERFGELPSDTLARGQRKATRSTR